MVHCIECEYRERLRRIKALPTEALRRITALRRAQGPNFHVNPNKIDNYQLIAIGHSLHRWIYGEERKKRLDGDKETADAYANEGNAIIDLVYALAKFQENVTMY